MILPKIDYQQNQNHQISLKVKGLIDKVYQTTDLTKEELLYLLDNCTQSELVIMEQYAQKRQYENYQNRIYLRGLIEISNYCKQGCKYCGIRSENQHVTRYRLTKKQILECITEGYLIGYRTFVMQGGEDPFFNDQRLGNIIQSIKTKYNDVAVTISVGERSKESYQNLFYSGANRFLLRHEAASKRLYNYLHPNYMSYENRQTCLRFLKEIGYQTGCGFMVNSPTQTNQDLVQDFRFIKEFQPEMCGIGPYISHSKTPLRNNQNGTLNQMRFCISLARLMIPYALLPATTAVATVVSGGREVIIKAGGNVIMPNLSPASLRKNYEIYENKVSSGNEAAQYHQEITKTINDIGYQVDMQIGHVKGWK